MKTRNFIKTSFLLLSLFMGPLLYAQESNTSYEPPTFPLHSDKALRIVSNKNGTGFTNENIYMSIGNDNNWWNNVKLEIIKEGTVATRGGQFSDYHNLRLTADWNNNNEDESIIFGFNGNVGGMYYTERMRLTHTGFLGIGVDAPESMLHVNGTTYMGDDAFVIRDAVEDSYTLFVAQGILSEDYGIAPQSAWADYVFSNDYELNSLAEVEAFITKNNHLPNIPSQESIANDGYNMHNMHALFLEKIEELTLYTIAQEKEIKALEKKINQYEKLQERIEKLEKQQ